MGDAWLVTAVVVVTVGADVLIGQPGGDETDDLTLAVGEHVEPLRAARHDRALGQLGDDPPGDAGREQCVGLNQ